MQVITLVRQRRSRSAGVIRDSICKAVKHVVEMFGGSLIFLVENRQFNRDKRNFGHMQILP